MNTTPKTVYRSGIDWWFWLVAVGALAPCWLIALDPDTRLAGIIISVGMIVLFYWLCKGCWYEIDGEGLVVYQFFKPHRMPVSKISSVKKTSGYLATAGMSHRRVTISFVDRSVLKSYSPLEISPADRDGFIDHLIKLNPQIELLK